MSDPLNIPEKVARRISGVAIERPRDEVPYGIPVALRSAQHSVISAGRFAQAWSKRMVLVKWVISGQAIMGVHGQRVTFGPGEAAVYMPSIPHRFWAVANENEMCWFSVDGPLAEQFAIALELRSGIFAVGPAPVDKIHEMMESLKDHSIQGRRQASLLAISMLYQLANAITAPQIPSVVLKAQYKIQQEFANPDLSAESIAKALGYHRGSLSRLFHKHTGITIIDFLTEARLQEARGLLAHTNDKISDIAKKCGFREATYFHHWFRKHTGLTPKDLRSNPL
jgi:AraC-like DNA-binding protein